MRQEEPKLVSSNSDPGKRTRQFIKALLCEEVNVTLSCADSSRKSSQGILGVIWDVPCETQSPVVR